MRCLLADTLWQLSAVIEKHRLFPQLATAKAFPNQVNRNAQELSQALANLESYSQGLGMDMSSNQVQTIRQQATMPGFGHRQLKSLLEDLQRRVHEELQRQVCTAIEPAKASFADPLWPQFLVNDHGHAALFNEFHSAGVCFALAQNTACVFHLMRVADYGLKKVAQSLGITHTAQGWHAVAENIRKKMEQKHQSKPDAWRQSEPFYARILTDVQALGKAYRNDTIHDLSVNYNDRETRYMLTVVEEFTRHVLQGLS